MFAIRRAWTAHMIGWLLFGLTVFTLPAFAQSGKGAISGTIEDNTGSVLKGARIELLQLGIVASANNQG